MSDAEREATLRRHIAATEKEKGNVQFKEKKYAAAIACYTRGLESDPDNAVLLANRAMAHLNMKQHVDAELDCTRCIALDKTFIKAYQRRASAREALGKFKEAAEGRQTAVDWRIETKSAFIDTQILPL